MMTTRPAGKDPCLRLVKWNAPQTRHTSPIVSLAGACEHTAQGVWGLSSMHSTANTLVLQKAPVVADTL